MLPRGKKSNHLATTRFAWDVWQETVSAAPVGTSKINKTRGATRWNLLPRLEDNVICVKTYVHEGFGHTERGADGQPRIGITYYKY